jgi:hypothetical protein
MKQIDKLKKLKEQYHLEDKFTSFYGHEFQRAYKCKSRYFREFSTKQERSYYQLHLAEYQGLPLRLRARRGNALPTSWDDLPTGVYDAEKCWKTSTRRKTQWYRIKEM